MNPIPNNVDWAATAAWIALAISIVSPFITARMNNKHQLKLRELDIKQKQAEEYASVKFDTIDTFISCVGRCIANPTAESIEEVNAIYYKIYLYVPKSLHRDLNTLRSYVNVGIWVNAETAYQDFMLKLIDILKEESQETP